MLVSQERWTSSRPSTRTGASWPVSATARPRDSSTWTSTPTPASPSRGVRRQGPARLVRTPHASGRAGGAADRRLGQPVLDVSLAAGQPGLAVDDEGRVLASYGLPAEVADLPDDEPAQPPVEGRQAPSAQRCPRSWTGWRGWCRGSGRGPGADRLPGLGGGRRAVRRRARRARCAVPDAGNGLRGDPDPRRPRRVRLDLAARAPTAGPPRGRGRASRLRRPEPSGAGVRFDEVGRIARALERLRLQADRPTGGHGDHGGRRGAGHRCVPGGRRRST